jgi:hypothetical protein
MRINLDKQVLHNENQTIFKKLEDINTLEDFQYGVVTAWPNVKSDEYAYNMTK